MGSIAAVSLSRAQEARSTVRPRQPFEDRSKQLAGSLQCYSTLAHKSCFFFFGNKANADAVYA